MKKERNEFQNLAKVQAKKRSTKSYPSNGKPSSGTAD